MWRKRKENMNQYYQLNLNDTIKVKFKPEGVKIWLDYYNQYSNKYTEEDYKKGLDEEGYKSLQLWHFMQLFGHHIDLGRIAPFELNILIQSSSLTTPLKD